MKKWTNDEVKFLKKYYPNKGIKWCSKHLNRTIASIQYKVWECLKLRINKKGKFYKDFQKRAGKTKQGRKRSEHSEYMKKNSKLINRIVSKKEKIETSKRIKKWIKQNGHPKGALGKHWNLSEEFKKKQKDRWTDEMKQKQSDVMLKNIKEGKMMTPFTQNVSWKQGHYDINGIDYFFRSKWEANYALYLDWLKQKDEIKKWTYEEDTFWFEQIKRGVRSYKPDFKIYNNDKSYEYHEVKGWMDARSKTKIKRMAKYYPDTKLILIQEKEYNAIKKWGKLFGWI